jgi:hypothetical protein
MGAISASIASEVDSMSQHPPLKARFREICKDDASAVVELLTEGFPSRSRPYWQHAIDVLDGHSVPEGYPRYGYLVESGGVAVGVLLLIATEVDTEGGSGVRCNLSSWYARPEFRGHAALLVSYVLKRHPEATFVNVSAVRHTWPTIEAQGFQRYSDGTFVGLPLLSRAGRGARVSAYDVTGEGGATLTEGERRLLGEHVRLGCLALVVEIGGEAVPFVFRRLSLKGLIPAAQLVWCRNFGDLARCASPIGGFLLRCGLPLLAVDANGPIAGLPGYYFADRMPKYYRGPARPRPGDMSFTELALFG